MNKKSITTAFYLLTLTIGAADQPARIYTFNPAEVLETVSAAGEKVTAYEITEL